MNKIIYLLIIIILYFLIQNNYIYKINSNYDILQSNNPNKETLEKIINQKSPSIFTNIISKDSNINNENIQNEAKKYNKLLNYKLNYYLIPMSITYNYKIIKENEKIENKLIKETSSRHLIFQIKGTQKIILFNPNQTKFLYSNKNVSRVNYWKQDLKKYPLINKSQFIEIILREGQLIYIPKKWWYTNKSIDNTTYISCKSESIFSYFMA